MFKFDSNALPIMGIGVEGDFDRVDAARTGGERPVAAPRARRRRRGGHASTAACAARFTSSSRKEKITALDLSVDRVVSTAPHREPEHPARRDRRGRPTYLLRSQGQFENLDQIRDLVVLTQGGRAGLPAGHRRGAGHDRGPPLVHAHQRQAGRPHAGHQAVGHEHGRRSPTACAPRSSASTAKCPGVKLIAARRQLDVHRALDRTPCRSTRCIGARPGHR